MEAAEEEKAQCLSEEWILGLAIKKLLLGLIALIVSPQERWKSYPPY